MVTVRLMSAMGRFLPRPFWVESRHRTAKVGVMPRNEVSDAIDLLLAEQSFRRHGSTWVRTRNLFSDVVDLQRAKLRDRVTVNVGLMHVPTYEIVWGKSPEIPLSEVDCTVRARLGFLIDGHDHWWRLDDRTAVADIVLAISSAALPFLSGFRELKDVERWLDASQMRYPPERLYAAAVKQERGKTEEARHIVQQLLHRTKNGPWKERISSMAASLG